MAKNANNKVAIAAVGGIESIINVARTAADAVTMRYAAGALRNLTCNNDENKAAVLKDGGVDALVFIVKNCDDDRSREEAAAALGNIARMASDSHRLAVAEAGAIGPLVDCVEASAFDGCRTAAAGALAILACNDQNAARIAVDGGVYALAGLAVCARASEKAREEAAVALRNLTCRSCSGNKREARHMLLPILMSRCAPRPSEESRLEKDLATTIADLVAVVDSSSNSDRARASAAVALSNLTPPGNEANATTLVSAGGVAPLVRFAREVRSQDGLYEAVNNIQCRTLTLCLTSLQIATLRNLTAHVLAWRQMRDAEVFPVLVRHLTGSTRVVDQAVSAIANLLNVVDNHIALKDAHGTLDFEKKG